MVCVYGLDVALDARMADERALLFVALSESEFILKVRARV